VGACLLATEKSFQAAVPQLCSLAKALRAEAGDDSLLLHIDATTGKVRSQLPASTRSLIASPAALQWRCPCSERRLQLIGRACLPEIYSACCARGGRRRQPAAPHRRRHRQGQSTFILE